MKSWTEIELLAQSIQADLHNVASNREEIKKEERLFWAALCDWLEEQGILLKAASWLRQGKRPYMSAALGYLVIGNQATHKGFAAHAIEEKHFIELWKNRYGPDSNPRNRFLALYGIEVTLAHLELALSI